MRLLLGGILFGATLATGIFTWIGHRFEVESKIIARDERQDMLQRYEKMEDAEQGVTVQRKLFLPPPAKPGSLLILDEWGSRVFIEWEEGLVESRVSSNLKGLLSDVPFPTERFDDLRKWWGEMNELPRTGPQQAIGEHPVKE